VSLGVDGGATVCPTRGLRDAGKAGRFRAGIADIVGVAMKRLR
jgi:hypothetical protein